LKASSSRKKPQAVLLGLGLDKDQNAEEAPIRLTRGKSFVLYGGSSETHAEMRETVVKVTERLDRQGKRLEDVSSRELRDIFHEVRP